MKKVLAIGAVIALSVSLTGCASFDTFTKAIESCGSPEGITIGDEGKTMTVDMMGEDEWSGASLDDTRCIIKAVGTPDYIIADIESTNSLAGRQDAEFEGISATWDYHPDNGLDITFHKN